MVGRPLHIVTDCNIPYLTAPLSTVGIVTPLPAREITPEVMAGTDVLITRTRTRCDSSLLAESPCRFIGTATIGTDHIDLPWCRERGIKVANAPRCNAPAVAQWVLASLRDTLPAGRPLADVTLGVIGAGNVGSILIRWARGLGMKVLVNDPPLQAADPTRYDYRSLGDIARECDAITVHTPLTRDGAYPTLHLIGREFVGSLRRRPIILNAARGPVTDTDALLRGLDARLISAVAIDCWEGEPRINRELLDRATVATPHIAGYSIEGKTRASQMILDALTAYLALPPLRADAPAMHPTPEVISTDRIGYPGLRADTMALKADPASFETLRNTYPLRPEPS